MNKLHTSCLLLLLLFVAAAHSLSAQVTLRILDATSGDPVAYATVVSQDKSFQAVSDEFGILKLPESLTSLPSTTIISLSHISYEPYSLTIADLRDGNWVVRMRPGFTLGDVVVTAVDKELQSLRESARQVEVIGANDVSFKQPSTSADLLAESGKVFVQKSQGGGGSPVLRGFEANKVLLVVDGVRLNNAIYRSGHLQNVISMDESMLDRLEVVYGPGSVIYGSDALGGVMHFYTRNPALSWDDSLRFGINAWGRYASASDEKATHLDFQISGKKLSYLAGGTYKDIGDVKAGEWTNPFYPDYGTRPDYVETIAGSDVVIPNENPFLQIGTGFKQYNLFQKLRYKPNEKVEFLANFQYTSSSDIPRYDRLTQTTEIVTVEGPKDRLRFAEWYYGPQEWMLGSVRMNLLEGGRFANSGSVILAYQKVGESRINRQFDNPLRTIREESLDIFSVNADFSKTLSETSSFGYGIELTYNGVESDAYRLNIFDGERSSASTRYPDGGTDQFTYAGYLRYNKKWDSGLNFSASTRYSQITLDARFVDTTFFNFPFNEINVNTGSLTGSLGLVYNPNDSWKLSTAVSSGFRAPNLDDIAKVFDSSPGAVIVPNDNLSPENAYSGEIGIRYTYDKRFQIDLTVWQTELYDAIIRDVFTFNGQDSILYEGELSAVLANVNAGRARINGISVDTRSELNSLLSARATFNWTRGRDLSSDVPLGHIPPIFGLFSLEARHNDLRVETYIRYNGWKHIEDYSPSGVDNQEEATEFGTPSWYTLNLRGAYQVAENIRFNLAFENILDKHYRPFSSGVSAPGRNIIIGLNVGF